MPAIETTLAIKYDGNLSIAMGESANAKVWLRKDLSWRTFLGYLQIPRVTRESMAEYRSMNTRDRGRAKDVGGYIGAVLQGTTRGKNDVVSRQLIALDLDDAEQPETLWELFCLTYDCAAALHSTHSHTPDKPKLRLLIPVTTELTPKNYTALAKAIAGSLGIAQFDQSTYEPNRLMFWPSVCKDGQYVFRVNDSPWLNPAPMLAKIEEEALIEHMAAEDPASLPGTPGVFCKKYNIHDVIKLFLKDIYIQAPNGRYRLNGAFTTGGFVLYNNDKLCYSHHTSDPAGGKLLNAFDLVRIHKFGKLDEGIAAAPQEMPSFKEMNQWIEDNDICEVISWIDNLQVDAKGRPKSTIDNMHQILIHDLEVREKFYYDEFSDKLMVYGDFPWIGLMDRCSTTWNDTDDAGIRSFLERKYGISDAGKTNDAISLSALEQRYHPVRDYLAGLTWDETPRLDTLLIDFLGAEDCEYTRAVTRKALIGAVARIMQPGCKHDHVLTLVGPQGCRKSTTIHLLGGKWYTDSLYSMGGKEAYELLQGYWIVEISEMAAARKADVEQMKQFISKQTDNFRAAYARRTLDHPRQCAFFGSTNDVEFLKDPTGNRRFWPVMVKKVPAEVYAGLTKQYIDQIWAEAVLAFKLGENWYLEDKIEEVAMEIQAKHSAMSPLEGAIREFLSTKVPLGWNSMSREERKLHYMTGAVKDGVLRDRICAAEIWCEMLNSELRDLTTARSQEIGNLLRKLKDFKPLTTMSTPYGRQRGFQRIEGA